ncbi:hypothetical protein CERSUDRAFT_110735 [Gelatoporia subvermispora B]|uniref:Uncharacterized protein n=1 Tax=Ceriporiopsis subvermispora (strain B) TaxID=914234 RepID=M2PZ40_CERS8|nr:hypothetical protein CERSUDRAFT_110735 [Gelatoporia subvermispora B]
MATTATSRATPSATRRSSPTVNGASTSPASSISRGATARSAVSARPTPAARRASVKAPTPPTPHTNGETRESLSASLKQETEKKEQLLVQVQDKEQTISTLRTENDQLTSALNSAESRLAELYADQSRMEEEMSARIEVIEKLRTQVRELEKEKRDLHRRYNEQTATFEAERQAFYDNEQHLKSRIQSLTQARKQPLPVLTSPSVLSITESETEVEEEPINAPSPTKQDMNDPEQEPAEMTALKLELSTLSTSYGSLQSTLQLLQTQLVDLKRVNNELQEENESYNILLREKTLNGQFDVLRMGGATTSDVSGSDGGGDEASLDGRHGESFKSRNTSRSTLDPVDELAEEHEEQPELDPEFRQDFDQEPRSPEPSSRSGRRHRKQSSASRSPAPRGESLANLPITGPGLDLAAELGRAENKDILEGQPTFESDRSVLNDKGRKGKNGPSTDRHRVASSSSDPTGTDAVPTDLDALRSEVKSLKDANRALSLYASKIIDRIISQEGFEHVLAVDYDKLSTPPTTAGPGVTTFSNVPKSPSATTFHNNKKGRPQSAVFSNGGNTTSPPQERLTTFSNSPQLLSPTPSSPGSSSSNPSAAPASTRASRRSLSFDWKSFSMFGGEKKPEPNANLRPLTLRAGAPPVTFARKLDTLEDEDDRRERERLNATMKLMGIEKPMSPAAPAMGKSYSSPANPNGAADADTSRPPSILTPGTAVPPTPVQQTPASATTSRFSFFRRASMLVSGPDASSQNSSAQSSPGPGSGSGTPNLTQEALEQAEAESSLAALDAAERQLSAEIAKGGTGGYTEIVRRNRDGDRRSSRRSGGSGSTVWSAGMSKGEDGDE